MANCYRLWDAYEYKEATENIRTSALKTARENTGRGHWGYNEKHTCGTIDVLDILSKVNDRRTLFEEEKRVIHYAVDRYLNAIRRKKSRNLDDAMVRFAQVIEMLCIFRIYQITANNKLIKEDGHNVAQQQVLGERWKIRFLIRLLFGQERQYFRRQGKFYQISDCNELLNIHDYDYTQVCEITTLIESRNDRVHFVSAMTQDEIEDNTKKLQKLACKFLKNFSCSYCSTNGLSFDELLDLHKFRLKSLPPVKQLVKELNCLTDSRADKEYALQIYSEIQSFGGENSTDDSGSLESILG